MRIFSVNLSCGPRCKEWSVGAAVFLLGAAVSAFVVIHLDRMRTHDKLHVVQSVAHEHASRLHKHIDESMVLAYPIAAAIETGMDTQDFTFIADKLITHHPLIHEIALAPEGIITHIVPVKGNEKALGLDLLRHPEQKAEALLALKSGKLTLAGPIRLMQGGEGVVGRFPVFRKEDQTFWGFVLIVIKMPDLLHSAALGDLSAGGYRYELTRTYPNSKQVQIISASDPQPLDRPIRQRIAFPNADWTLSISPAAGWHDRWTIFFQSVLGILFSLLAGYIAKQYVELRNQRNALEHRVAERVTEISLTQNRLRLLLNTIPDLIWLKDTGGTYLLCNPMFERFFGAKETEIVGKSDYDFVDRELADFFRAKDRLAMEKHAPSVNEEWLTFTDDGHTALMETIKTPMIDETGNLVGILGIARDITERHTNETRIRQLTHLYAALSNCNKAIVRSSTPQELFDEVCRGIVSEEGMNMAWIGLVDPQSDLVRPVASYGDRFGYLEGIEISIREEIPSGNGPTGTAIRENRPYWCQDFMNDPATAPWHERGEAVGWQSSASLPFHLYGKPVGAFMVYSTKLNAFDPPSRELLIEMAMDISFAMENFDREAKRKAVEEDLIRTEKLLEEMSEAALIGGWGYDVKTGKGTWTKVTARIHDMDLDAEATEQIGLSVYEGESLEKIKNAIHDAIARAMPYDLIVHMTTPAGNKKWVRTIGIPVIENGEVIRLRGSIQDITAQKATEDKVHWLAHFDSLTGLPNRTLLNDRLNYAIRIAYRNHTSVALLYLDLDHFKNINENLGHHIGDELLVQVALRIQSMIRESDTLSRQGGDEFMILLSGIDAEGAANVAEKLIESISQPYQIQSYELSITPSIGIALYPGDGTNFTTLSQAADAAMFRAKHNGRNRYCFFTPEMQARSARNLEIENALRHAVARDQLQIHYQPQISLSDGKLIGTEALLRWTHPELGAVSPDEFIPVAEESGQIVAIGDWVLRHALGQLKAWIDAGAEPFIMAVNLSAVQFRSPQLTQRVLEILEELALPPEHLELELTERIASENPLEAINIMNTLYDNGIRMSIDDFGTGYSSLSYLKQFKAYKLKIDQSFIHDVAQNPEDRTIVNTIIKMAHSLNMKTIAEGVETAEQLGILRAAGCDEVQGYYYEKPIPAQEFERKYVQSFRK
ncbi:MAG: EAL domain-containing protein [Sulfuricurvum sp.]